MGRSGALTVRRAEARLRPSTNTVSTLAGERTAPRPAACAARADAWAGAAAWVLPGLVLLLPFEPRRPALTLGPLTVTPLELAAALALLALACTGAAQLRALVRRPPLPLLAVALYALVHLASAAVAVPGYRWLALKFAARMVAMAAFAFAVAASPPAARRRALLALAATALAIGAAAALEGAGLRALDPVLDRFREMPFNVAGSRRATAFSEYPNLAAGFLLYGLQAVAGLALAAVHPLRWCLPATFALSLGLLYTYSRGALVAAAVGLLALAVLLARDGLRRARVPLAALVTVCLTAAGFAWGGEIFRLRLGAEGTEAFYAAAYQPSESSLRLRPGERRTTTVRVTNLGRKTWAVGEAFHLSYHWYDQERVQLEDGGRTRLPRDLARGDSATLAAEVRAPQKEGRYLLVWDMVHEHTTWFSGQGVAPAVVPTVVSAEPQPAPAPPAGPPAVVPEVAWRPGRAELWRLAVDMWKERPLLGVGSDNFRWLHGPRAGRPMWDSRVFANSLYLEAAATTGTLGLAALVAALAAALAWSARRVRSAARLEDAALAAAVFAGLAALAAHGLVDYLLAFTGHYLMLGLLVGLASAPEGAPGQPRPEAMAAR
jgi:hypothetical protein